MLRARCLGIVDNKCIAITIVVQRTVVPCVICIGSDTRATSTRTTILVHNSGDDNIACTIPHKRSIESKVLLCGGCSKLGRTVNRIAGHSNPVRIIVKLIFISSADVNSKLFCVTGTIVPREGNTLDWTCGHSCLRQFLGSEDLLAIGITPVVMYRYISTGVSTIS